MLVEQGMQAEAGKLLEKVGGSFEEHIYIMLEGYILASQNKCIDANKKFTLANTIAGRECVPIEYRKNCSNQTLR